MGGHPLCAFASGGTRCSRVVASGRGWFCATPRTAAKSLQGSGRCRACVAGLRCVFRKTPARYGSNALLTRVVREAALRGTISQRLMPDARASDFSHPRTLSRCSRPSDQGSSSLFMHLASCANFLVSYKPLARLSWREFRQKRGDQGQQITRQRSDLSRGPTPCTAITAA